jgi:hypothetical protein
MRAVYRWWSAIVFIAVLLQIAFAGYGAFYTVNKADEKSKLITNHGVDHGWGPHLVFGYFVILLGLVLVPIAFLARVDRERKRWAGLVAILMIVQFFLAVLGWTWAPLGVFHPINAIAIAAVTGMLARSEWKGGSTTAVAAHAGAD